MSDRNFFRLAVDLKIEVAVADFPAALAATLVDISEGGCKISATSMILKDAELSFEVARPGKVPLKLRGRVAHVEFKPMASKFEYGIQYIGLRAAEADAIYQFVVEEQRRKLQVEGGPGKAEKNGKVEDRKAVLRVERKFPIEYVIYGQRNFLPATATDVSRGGMRVIFPQRPPEDRTFEFRFTFPSDVLEVLTRKEHSRDVSVFGREIKVKEHKARPFPELRVQIRVLPGWHEIRGAFHYSVQFLRPKPQVIEEIERFLHSAQLTELKAKRTPEKTIWH